MSDLYQGLRRYKDILSQTKHKRDLRFNGVNKAKRSDIRYLYRQGKATIRLAIEYKLTNADHTAYLRNFEGEELIGAVNELLKYNISIKQKVTKQKDIKQKATQHKPKQKKVIDDSPVYIPIVLSAEKLRQKVEAENAVLEIEKRDQEKKEQDSIGLKGYHVLLSQEEQKKIEDQLKREQENKYLIK